MLSQVLPGLRELRGPLAAGFLWLLLGWLVFHHDVARAQGEVKEFVELGEELSPAGLATAASFAAYLIGSLSEDAFGWVMRNLIASPLFKSPRRAGLEKVEQLQLTGGGGDFRQTQLLRVENDADRLVAESDLRAAILPPLAAILVYLAITDRPWWLLGLLITAGFLMQAGARTRDYLFARDALFTIRRELGVPAASAAEARAEAAAKPTNVKLSLLDYYGKGKRLLDRGDLPTSQADEWADQVAAFLRENAREDHAAMFMSVTSEAPRARLSEQLALVERFASEY